MVQAEEREHGEVPRMKKTWHVEGTEGRSVWLETSRVGTERGVLRSESLWPL